MKLLSYFSLEALFKDFFYFYFLKCLLIFERERERDRAPAGEGQREREREKETQNLKQAPGSELSAQSLTQGLNSRAARS